MPQSRPGPPCFVSNRRTCVLPSVILGKSHYVLYGLVAAMQPRMLVTFDEELRPLPVSVRVGQVRAVPWKLGNVHMILLHQNSSGGGEAVLLALLEPPLCFSHPAGGGCGGAGWQAQDHYRLPDSHNPSIVGPWGTGGISHRGVSSSHPHFGRFCYPSEESQL